MKITNPKISPALVQELQDESAYETIEAFSATHTFLSNLLYICRDQDFALISATKIKEWFEAHDVNYKKCLDALVKHNLITIDKHYVVGLKPRGYQLTEKGASLMYAGQMQYLKQVFNDNKLKRKLQQTASYQRTHRIKNKHPFLEYVSLGLMRYTFDPVVLKFVNDSNWSYLTKLKAALSLTSFTERKFVEQKYNEADSRCWNEFVGMKTELRRFFSLGNLRYSYVIDIRSCHPSFFAHYLVYRARPMGWQTHHPMLPGNHDKTVAEVMFPELKRSIHSSNPISTTHQPSTTNQAFPVIPVPANPILHYDGGKCDILAELQKWNGMFSDPAADPKTMLIQDLGYTKEQAKSALNHTINGSRQYGKFIKWFEKHFPKLYAVWDKTYKREVGVGISTWYETQLMQDFTLYELATTLGLHLTYEFDGCGVMRRPDDAEVQAKIQRLIQHIQAHSERKWGIRPVIVVKNAAGDAIGAPSVTKAAKRRKRKG